MIPAFSSGELNRVREIASDLCDELVATPKEESVLVGAPAICAAVQLAGRPPPISLSQRAFYLDLDQASEGGPPLT